MATTVGMGTDELAYYLQELRRIGLVKREEPVLSSRRRPLYKLADPVFEQVCAEWLWRQNAQGNLPVFFDTLGRWWGSDPSTKREEEIDVVGVDEKSLALAAECKWRNEPLGESVSKELLHRVSIDDMLA